MPVFCGAMAGGQYSGAIMNPARALGPALVYGLSAATTSVYVLAQLAGGVLAASLAGLFYGCVTAGRPRGLRQAARRREEFGAGRVAPSTPTVAMLRRWGQGGEYGRPPRGTGWRVWAPTPRDRVESTGAHTAGQGGECGRPWVRPHPCRLQAATPRHARRRGPLTVLCTLWWHLLTSQCNTVQ
jgi:hypothetical protein